MKIVLKPTRGVSFFKVGESIHSYLKLYPYKMTAAKGDESWDEYDFFDEKIEVYVDKETDIIETIACRYSCIYNSLELIGADFDEFLQLAGKDKDILEKDVLWVSDSEQQTAYEIEDLFLQVWVTSDNLIACIFVS